MELNIGDKIKSLRLRNNLTQKELADRCELSKGFISQLESNQTSPSLSTLEDILVTLGSSFREFFASEAAEKPVYRKEDVFIKESPDLGAVIHWLIPNAQKKDMEPILMTLSPGGHSEPGSAPHRRGIRLRARGQRSAQPGRALVQGAQGGQLLL